MCKVEKILNEDHEIHCICDIFCADFIFCLITDIYNIIRETPNHLYGC